MRMIRRVVLLAVIGVAVVAADHWSDNGWPFRSRAAARQAEHVKQEVVKFGTRVGSKASVVAARVSYKVSDGTLTAKIKSKMALDDHVNGRAIDVDTSGSVVTVRGSVGSAGERERALRLARDTEGVTQVIDRLRVRQP